MQAMSGDNQWRGMDTSSSTMTPAGTITNTTSAANLTSSSIPLANNLSTQVSATRQTTGEQNVTRNLTEEQVQLWINQLEQWTSVFYNQTGVCQNHALWQEAQAKLVQFQKIHEPFDLCVGIIKKSHNPLVLYQATLCLKNAVANDFKQFNNDELLDLFQVLYEFLNARALENDMSVNETTALICAMILKRVASNRSNITTRIGGQHPGSMSHADKDLDRFKTVINTLCAHVRDPNESLAKKLASAMMLNSLLLECQMTSRTTSLGIRVWKHLNARRLVEVHLKPITEVCLETINWAFTSNMLNPADQKQETQILFHLVRSLVQCVELALSFSSSDYGCAVGGDRVIRVLQTRTINMLSQDYEQESRFKPLRDHWNLVMSPNVVQFLFTLYTTVKSMINCVPGWDWPANLLKNCLNCLYYLSDVHNTFHLDRDDSYSDFIGNLMIGAVKIMDTETRGIDDSYQIACLITAISLHTSETRDTITKIKAEHFVPFLDAVQRFTCKVFTQVASTSARDEEEEEEKTVDALLDFWYHLLRNIEAEIKWAASTKPPQIPKIDTAGLKAYSRVIVESYISCHLHKPLGQVVPKPSDDVQEVDLDQADEQDDNSIYAQQLVSFGMVARIDTSHTAKLLIELLSTRVGHLETLLTQFIATRPSPEGLQDWEFINDDLHWLLLMLQHYFTQTGYGEVGFMCDEILNTSLQYEANVQKTLQSFEKFDYSSPEVDPVVRLMIITLKLCQMEMGICQSGKLDWLSVQTNGTLTTLLSRFCLTYLYPKESDFAAISESMNHCFGQDAPTAEKFLKFVIEHTCCIILHLKTDPQVVKKNVTLLIQLLIFHDNIKKLMAESDEGSMTKMFVSQLKPDNLTGFSPKVAKCILRLATRLFVEDYDWNKLSEFFTNKWMFITMSMQNGQHNSELVANKLLEFCDFAVGVCEACDDDTSSRLFEQLLVPIVKALPAVMKAFANFDNVPIAVFDLLYNIVRYPLVNITTWECGATKMFYESCVEIIDAYASGPQASKKCVDEEDCEDMISLLNFNHEVMKRDWGNSSGVCDMVIKFSMEKLSTIVKPEHLQFPRIRSLYYRLLVYLVDDDDRMGHLSDILLNTIVSSILLALQSKFDKDVDNQNYTIISIVCRTIFHERGTDVGERLAKFMMPVLPALFQATMTQSSYSNTETAEMVAAALFSLRCCYMDLYESLVKDLIEKQNDAFVQSKVKSLFETLESKIQKLTLNRSACREFNSLFVPFLAELHNYVTIL